MSKEKKHSEEKKKERRKVVTAIILVVLIILLAILLYLLLGKDESRNVVVNEDNVEQVIEERDPVEEITYEAMMNSTWNFASGTAKSDNAYVKNAEGNDHPVYFEVKRADTGEQLYESPVLEVGSQLSKFALDKDLPDGTYDCIITYHVLDEKQEDLGTVNLTLTINVGQ